MPDLQTQITGPDGRYRITELPPGDDYVVHFYYGTSENPSYSRSGIRLGAGKTIVIDARLSSQGQAQVQVIRETAPSVDVANATSGIEINEELLRQMPLRGRNYQSSLFLAPGAADVAARNFNKVEGSIAKPGGDVGVSISGATGAENAYLIDGVNVTDPGLGVLSSELSQYFIKEIQLLTGGYQAEYGRAMGGIVSVVTKSGGNQLHGGVYQSWAPFQATAPSVARLGEAISRRVRPDLNTWDLAFDLGGALLRDRIWFYTGLAVTSVSVVSERSVRRQVFDGLGPRALPDFSCPSYLADSRFCDGPSALAKETQELGNTQRQTQTRSTFNPIAKLQFHLRPDHDLFLSYFGAPNVQDTFYEFGTGAEGSRYSETNQVHDVLVRYTGKTLGKRLLIDLTYALHYQSQQQQPRLPDVPLVEYTASAARPFSLADFEPLPGCQVEVASGFNPCPITRYVTGLGIYRTQELLRHQARSAVTLFLSGLGLHSIKAGFDFEYLSSNLTLGISGQPGYNAVYRTTADGSDIRRGSGLGTLIDGQPRLLDRFQSTTGVRNWTAYLRDSWSIASTGLTLNAGVRWEGVEVLGGTGKTELSNMANFAPRIGAVWDYTRLFQRPGRGKLFVNYGRFYESIGTDLADRAFNGQGGYVQRYSGMSSGCPLVPRQSGGRPLPTPGSGCNFDASVAFAGSSVEVIPGTSASAVDEVSAGVSYDLGYDFVVSASYLYRTLNNVIEDLSVDDGANYYVGTPGKSLDPATLAAAEADAQRLADLAASAGASAADKEAAAQAAARLTAYKGIADMPKATRDYHALVLSLSKRLSHRFSLLGSYTFSRTVGNYPGTYDSVTGQLNPHTATLFDLPGHIANSDGTLPTDRPHNFKLTGFYQQPLGTTGVLTFSATFSAISGRPIDVLGAHPAYGQVFILPRGSGGRTPTVTQTDVHLGYDHMIAEKQHMGVYLDVVNLFNQSEVVNVDDIYTYSPVNPLLDESSRKSLDIKTVDGSKLVYNSNYGQPTGFQAPLYLRLGARITF